MENVKVSQLLVSLTTVYFSSRAALAESLGLYKRNSSSLIPVGLRLRLGFLLVPFLISGRKYASPEDNLSQKPSSSSLRRCVFCFMHCERNVEEFSSDLHI